MRAARLICGPERGGFPDRQNPTSGLLGWAHVVGHFQRANPGHFPRALKASSPKRNERCCCEERASTLAAILPGAALLGPLEAFLAKPAVRARRGNDANPPSVELVENLLAGVRFCTFSGLGAGTGSKTESPRLLTERFIGRDQKGSVAPRQYQVEHVVGWFLGQQREVECLDT
jgi:hypothetical protein